MLDSWKTFRTEMIRIKSFPNNNNISVKLIEKEVNKFISSEFKIGNKERRDNILFFIFVLE